MKRTIIAAIIALTGCTDKQQTIRTLEDAGYTEIQSGGYAAFQCSSNDTFQTNFKARNIRGKMVRGVVCCGLLKGCTVRH